MSTTFPVIRAWRAVVLAATIGISVWADDPPSPTGHLAGPTFEGPDVLFNWDNGGDLQVGPTPAGPWTTVHAPQNRSSNARLPALGDGNHFFRIVDNGVPGQPQPIVGGDPKHPYAIRNATLRKATGPLGNALLEARLEPGQNPPSTFPLLLDGSVIILHDDGLGGDAKAGDGVFSGALTVDPAEFAGSNEFIAALTREFGVIGTFDGRSVIDAHPPGLFDVDGFNKGDPIQVFPSPFLTGLGTPGGPRLNLGGRRAGTAAAGPLFGEICVTNVVATHSPVTNVVIDPVVTLGKTNLVPHDVVVFVDGLRTNVDCRPILLGDGTGMTNGINTTNLDVFLNRPAFANKSLMVTDLSAVEDPARTFDPCTGKGTRMGAWTFGRLMTDLCNEPVTGIQAGDFARRWLRSWQTEQVINFDTVTNRNPEILAQVIDAWEAASGGADKPLDLSIAPFRLLAIVNRVDLRGNPGYGGTAQNDPCTPTCVGGEARFVFCLIADAFKGGTGGGGGGGGYPGGGDGGGTPGTCAPSQFTVIFEYCVPKNTCGEIKEWGLQWYGLSQIPFGPAFNAALQKITDQFAVANADPSRHPNLSALNQLRANELLREPWDLREWRLFPTDSDAGWLREVTVKQTPDPDHNLRPIIAEYCAANAAQILAEKHVVPLEWRTPGKPRVPFLGGDAPMATAGFFWDGPAPAASSIPTPIRHKFSLNTCNGCHAGETGTPFTHVFPRSPGQEASLSDFLTGKNMPKLDPADGVTPHVFADLKRREDDLLKLISEPCFFQIFHEPALFTH